MRVRFAEHLQIQGSKWTFSDWGWMDVLSATAPYAAHVDPRSMHRSEATYAPMLNCWQSYYFYGSKLGQDGHTIDCVGGTG